MTAVFAFVFREKAVIATDTLRVAPMGLFANQTALKSYCWKGLIPFGGAGTGAFIQRVADYMAADTRSYSADAAGFLEAFSEGRKYVMDAINKSQDLIKKAVAKGVVLAAVPELLVPAHILRVDFATGIAIRCPADYAAEGTDPAAFEHIAGRVLSGLSGTSIDAYELTRQCVSDAVALHPEAVGWPMDLRVTQSGPTSAAVHLRLDPTMPKDFLKLT